MRLSSLLTVFISGVCFAQSIDLPGADPFFPRPSYFRKHFQPTPSRIELQPPVRLSDYVVENKLELSLKNFLELTVANNPDIVSQKVTVEFSRNAITRAFGAFDPTALARFNSTRTQTASSNVLVGATTLNQLQQPLSLQVSQTMQTGTQYVIAFNGTKTSNNSTFNTFNPQLNANINFSMVQPLLRGRGMFITRLPISIARSKLRVAGYTFEDQLIQLVAVAENAYWDVVGARENLRVQEENLKLADAALKRAQKELELGATSPLEIFQPQANYANAELSVSQGRFRLLQAEDALRRQMGADLDPNIRNLPIVLTETILPPSDFKVDREAAIDTALRQRPDVKAVVQNLDVDDLSIRQSNNLLLPDLSLTAQYGSSGLGGIFFPPKSLTDPTPVVPIVGGIRDALGGVFGFGFPVYGFGLTLRLPIKDRAASANLSDAVVQKRLDVLKRRSTEENVRLQVLTAISQLESSRESIRIATIARDLAQKRVEADQKRYELGTTTLFFVLASQTDYILAESNLVNQNITYRRNLLNLYQRTGQLLDERGIVSQ
jgi:outer membrane protein